MPRKKPINFPWKGGDKWTPTVGNAIERRLERKMEQLAATLNLEDPVEIEGLKVQLSALLRRCWAILRCKDQIGSDSRIYHTLVSFNRLPADKMLDCIMDIDPATRFRISRHYPTDFFELELNPQQPTLKRAVRQALETCPKPSPRDPTRRKNEALEKLAEGLAEEFARFGGNPARRNDTLKGKEYGPFHDFVEIIFSIIPRRLRRTLKGGYRSVDDVVKRAVESRKKAA